MLKTPEFIKLTRQEMLELFPYLIRDGLWKNAYLRIMMEEFCEGKDVTKYLDFSSEKQYNEWMSRRKDVRSKSKK